ncbi:substrate-binding domain-containing protein [Roseburia sp.]|jgi:phosphate transport system substrate-binding protein|uniref:substrate-binding domain-containing protein n=1 Tax=Roseburia sp. TaxID=2049040 RepID=UPI003520BA4D
MKKKVMCMLLTGMMAVGMIAGCGSNSSTNTGADASADAGSDASADGSADTTTDTTADTQADTTAADAASGDFDNSEYINVVSREDGSGTRGAFIELFGVEEKNDAGEKIDNTTDEAIITNSTDVMLTTVAGDEYSIGYVSLGSLNDSVKAVSIDGAEATVDNIKSGNYTIARPFNIATKGTPSDVAQDFINFIMSADGQAVISDNKYIPVDDGAAAFESNGASGKIVVAGSSSVTPVMEKLKEAYAAVNSGAEIEIQESDSTTGMTAAMDGTCDIGMASRELKDSETEGGLTATVIAMDGIAVIVNNDNPTADLSKDTVKGIYTGEITSWDGVTE